MLDYKIDNSKVGVKRKSDLKVEKTKHLNISIKMGVVGEKIWMGHTAFEPGAESSAQHHEQSDSVHYVLKGNVIFFYGNNFENSVELREGDFIYIPPYHTYIYKNTSNNESLDIVTTMAPDYQVVYVDQNEEIEIPKDIEKGEGISIVRASDLNDLTNQTKHMPRKTAVQAPNLWIGRVTGESSKDSGAHHHGDAETAGFIISGTPQILYGERYEIFEEFSPGDFLRVPAYLPHIERNLRTNEPVEFLTARNPSNIVVNLKS